MARRSELEAATAGMPAGAFKNGQEDAGKFMLAQISVLWTSIIPSIQANLDHVLWNQRKTSYEGVKPKFGCQRSISENLIWDEDPCRVLGLSGFEQAECDLKRYAVQVNVDAPARWFYLRPKDDRFLLGTRSHPLCDYQQLGELERRYFDFHYICDSAVFTTVYLSNFSVSALPLIYHQQSPYLQQRHTQTDTIFELSKCLCCDNIERFFEAILVCKLLCSLICNGDSFQFQNLS